LGSPKLGEGEGASVVEWLLAILACDLGKGLLDRHFRKPLFLERLVLFEHLSLRRLQTQSSRRNTMSGSITLRRRPKFCLKVPGAVERSFFSLPF